MKRVSSRIRNSRASNYPFADRLGSTDGMRFLSFPIWAETPSIEDQRRLSDLLDAVLPALVDRLFSVYGHYSFQAGIEGKIITMQITELEDN